MDIRSKERMAMLEKGIDPTLIFREPKRVGQDPLLWGLLLAGMGTGILLGYLVHLITGWDRSVLINSLAILFGGLGLVVFSLSVKKTGKLATLSSGTRISPYPTGYPGGRGKLLLACQPIQGSRLRDRDAHPGRPAGRPKRRCRIPLCRAFRKMTSFRGDSRWSTWLYRIVVNHSLTRARKRKRVIPYAGLELADDRF